MTEPFLILHKVRGEPAFDIAIQMECPICKEKWEHEDWVCGECNGNEYWWIIPTSGHRAYPYWSEKLDFMIQYRSDGALRWVAAQPQLCFVDAFVPMPEDWPDHCHYDLDRDKSPIASSDVQRALASLMKPQAPLARRRL